MGNFQNNAITDVGRMLLADVQAGAVFTPTRIVIGSGTMPSGATTQGMTDVITPVKSLQINKKKRTPDGKCIFGGVYTNEEVTVPFYFRELALYAKAVYLNEDGSVKSEGAEVLYSYGNAGATADYMAAYSTSTVVEKQMDLVTWVGNNAQVDLTIESGVFVVQEDFASHATRHAADGEDPITPESIGAAPGGYGLGGYPQKEVSLAELDSIFDTGWYILSQHGMNLSGVGFNYANVLVHCTAFKSCVQELRLLGSNIVLRRYAHLNEWEEWDVENPPFDRDVEYRTTERRNGKAVYKKLGADGVLRYRLEGDTAWNTYAQENGAAPAGYVTKEYHVNSDADIDAAMLDAYHLTADNSIGYFLINSNVVNLMLWGGVWHMTVYRRDTNYGMFELTSYDTRTTRKMTRSVYEGFLQPLAWDNPPMSQGEEFRTTERFHDEVVYKKIDANGNILWRKESESAWRLLSSASYVSPASVE